MANNTVVTGLVVALIVAFFVLFAIPTQYAPYTPGKPYAKYEAFTEGADAKKTEKDSADSNQPNEPTPSTDAASTSGGTSILDAISKYTTIKSNTVVSGFTVNNTENFEPRLDVPQTIQYGPFRDSEIIDKFSQVTANGVDGVNGCVSSGLSNSGGQICLTPELIKLLKTRGGNAS